MIPQGQYKNKKCMNENINIFHHDIEEAVSHQESQFFVIVSTITIY
jgi:hypothetical protein